MSKKTKNILSSIPEEKNHVWKVIINGKDKTNEVNHIRLESDNYGKIEFGYRNNSYPGLIIAENNGGGVIALPNFKDTDNIIWIGVLEQKRDNMHGKYSMIAGFVDKDEEDILAAKRETAEEFGDFKSRLILLNTEVSINANRAFFFTPTIKDGLKFYAINLNLNEVAKEGLIYRLKDNKFNPSDATSEKITDCLFIPLSIAVQFMQDAFAQIGIALLSEYLNKNNLPEKIVNQYKKLMWN